MDAPPTLLRNDSRGGVGLLVDASPTVLRIEVVAGEARQVGHRVRGGSYVSVDDSRQHFGLGVATRVDRLTTTDVAGRRRRFENLPADRVLSLPR